MSLHLTPEMLEQSYILLCTTLPFRRWRMPSADEVSFVVMSVNDRSADYYRLKNGTHRIRINNKWCDTLDKLNRDMAHEMVHLHLKINCPSNKGVHGKLFNSRAAQVCRHHVFALGEF